MMKMSKRLASALTVFAVGGLTAICGVSAHASATSPGYVDGTFDLQVNQLPAMTLNGDWSQFGNRWNWKLTDKLTVRNPDNSLVFEVDHLEAWLDSDPQVLLNFGVTAGAIDTTFTISSATVNFGALLNPSASASAAVTLTDGNGNGATFTGGYAGNTLSYTADTDLGNYAQLVPNVSAGSFLSNTSSGWTALPIVGSVTQMSSEFKFTVTKFDSASGTSNFTIVPEPAGLLAMASGLLGMAGLLRRRA